MGGLRVKNVCLSERKKKCAELWGLVSIYRGQKTLKNRYRWLWFKSGRILLRKIEKGMHNRHPKVVRPKSTSGKFGPFRVPFGTPLKVSNWPYGSECTFVFRCCLDSSSRVFCLVLVPKRVFILRLWFFISFLDNSGYLRTIIL